MRGAMTTQISPKYLLVAVAAIGGCAAAAPTVGACPATTASAALGGLRQRTSQRPLDLLRDLHDAETGLCSEGVWHNSMFGMALVLESRAQRVRGESDAAAESLGLAEQLAASLHRLNFEEGRGYRARTASGAWASAADPAIASAIEAAGEDPQFYLPSDEVRCSANAAALILSTFLLEEHPDSPAVVDRTSEIAAAFTSNFFDPAVGRFRNTAGNDASDEEPWRGVDQAMGILACTR